MPVYQRMSYGPYIIQLEWASKRCHPIQADQEIHDCSGDTYSRVAKKFIWVFLEDVMKNPNELSGQPSIIHIQTRQRKNKQSKVEARN